MLISKCFKCQYSILLCFNFNFGGGGLESEKSSGRLNEMTIVFCLRLNQRTENGQEQNFEEHLRRWYQWLMSPIRFRHLDFYTVLFHQSSVQLVRHQSETKSHLGSLSLDCVVVLFFLAWPTRKQSTWKRKNQKRIVEFNIRRQLATGSSGDRWDDGPWPTPGDNTAHRRWGSTNAIRKNSLSPSPSR